MFEISFTKILVVLIVALVVLGPDKLPEAVRVVSKWIRVIRNMAQSVQTELEKEVDEFKQEHIDTEAEEQELQDLMNEFNGSTEDSNKQFDLAAEDEIHTSSDHQSQTDKQA